MGKGELKISASLVLSALALAVGIAAGAWTTLLQIKSELTDVRERVARLEGQMTTVSQRTGIRLGRGGDHEGVADGKR